MLWTFVASFVVLSAFMLVLALGMILGRRKTECSCRSTARIMAAKTPSQRGGADDDSPFTILDNNTSRCHCGTNDRSGP